MARCRCGGTSACGCYLAAGDGTTVTGSGDVGAPWIISAEPRSTGTFQVLDSPSLDLEMTGRGTQSDPYILTGLVPLASMLTVADTPSVDMMMSDVGGVLVISADTRISGQTAFQDTADIAWTTSGAGTIADPLIITADVPCLICDAVGNVGDVLTLRADGTYTPGPPSTAPVGAVATLGGVIGDGSSADPVRLDLCSYDDLDTVCGSAVDLSRPTVAVAGSPGAFLPSSAIAPAHLDALNALGPLGQTVAWGPAQWVELGDASRATWNGTTWTPLVVFPATGAIPGLPGMFTPAGCETPPDLTTLVGLGALGQVEAWGPGMYVVLGDSSLAHWNGTAWQPGYSPTTTAVGAVAGIPGHFEPPGVTVPADLATLTALGSLGQFSAWTIGQHVVLGDASQAYWNETAWVTGAAP